MAGWREGAAARTFLGLDLLLRALGPAVDLPPSICPLCLPLDTGPEEGAAYEAAVDRGHAAYCAALHSLFEQHRERYAKGEAGLQLVE